MIRMSKSTKYIGIPVGMYVFYNICAAGFLNLLGNFGSVIVTMAVDIVMSLVCAGVMHRFLSDKKLGYVKRRLKDSKPWLWFLLFIPVYFLGQCAATDIYISMGDASYDSYTASFVSVSSALFIILTLFIAPMCEELFYRGIIFRSVKQLVHPLAAALMSAVFFAISHGTAIHLVPTFMLGILSCLVYEYTDNILCSILLHSLNNFVSLFAGNIPLPGFMFNHVFLLISIGLVMVAIGYMLVSDEFRTQRVNIDNAGIQSIVGIDTECIEPAATEEDNSIDDSENDT